MRATWSVALATLLLVGACASGSTGADGECTSHYEPVAHGPTRAALKSELLRDIDPRTHSLRTIDEDPGNGEVVVNLLSRRDRLIMSLVMWERHDGTWTAQRWSQCID